MRLACAHCAAGSVVDGGLQLAGWRGRRGRAPGPAWCSPGVLLAGSNADVLMRVCTAQEPGFFPGCLKLDMMAVTFSPSEPLSASMDEHGALLSAACARARAQQFVGMEND